MAWFASAADRSGRDADAAQALTQAMIKHPELVAVIGDRTTIHRAILATVFVIGFVLVVLSILAVSAPVLLTYIGADAEEI